MVRASIKHGLSASSCDGFAGYGIVLASLGKPNRAREMATAVELIFKRHGMHRMHARAKFIAEGFIYHHTAPIQASLSPLLAGYQTGLEIGDVSSASMCLMFRSIRLVYASRPLDGVLREMETNLDVLAQLNQASLKINIMPYLLMVNVLRGVSSAQCAEVSSFEDIMKIAIDSGNKTVRATTVLAQLELHVTFHEWGFALRLLENARASHKDLRGLFQCTRSTVIDALVCAKAAQATRSRLVKMKLERRAKKSMKTVHKWLKKGNVNLVHMMHLLTAELAVLNGATSEAEEQFKLAITSATKNGFLQDKGLAHELVGRFYVAQGDVSSASYHMKRAVMAYTDWGATVKVDKLGEENRELLRGC